MSEKLLQFWACCPYLNHWLAPILGCTEVPGAKVGGDDGDPEFKLTLRPVPAPRPRPWMWTLARGHCMYRWEEPGKHWLVVFVKMGKQA